MIVQHSAYRYMNKTKLLPGNITESARKAPCSEKRTEESYAVVTGSANGLGKELAIELSKRRINTILIDLPGKGLPELCKGLVRTYRTKSLFFETDLTKTDNLLSVSEQINCRYNVYILINNAGIGGTKKFDEADVAYLNRIIHLNVIATTVLTRQLLPNLKKQKKAYILNVASMAAFSPIGFKTVYPASKVFVYSFSRGLHEELKETNISVSVVNPGPMKTNKEVTNRINHTRNFFGKIGVMPPQKAARICLDQMLKGKASILLNKANLFNWLLMKITPADIKIPLITRVAYKEISIGSKIKK